MNELISLKPKNLWVNFQNICNIPHPSKKEEKIIEFVKKFGEDLGLKTIVDEIGNVIIKKPATSGMENRKGIILQGHLDMVPQANSDVSHNFETDPIQAYVDGDWVTAKGTTLGADNGIGAAAAMAVLQSTDIEHGPVEGLFTIDEETGMTGAFGLKPGLLDGDILLNMDSEDEGELYIGCAGGVDANITFNFKEESVPEGMTAFKIAVAGLKGGHSGLDIPLGRGNSNKLLIRFFKHAVKEYGLRISDIQGGSLRNAIPRESYAIVLISNDKIQNFKTCISKYEEIYKNELGNVEPGLSFTIEQTEMPAMVIDVNAQNKMIDSVYACPNGVIRMSDTMEGVVETSTNLAIIKSENGKIIINCLLRSSADSAKEDLAQMVTIVFELAGAEVELTGEYPGWKPNADSAILKIMQEVYNNKYGKIPEIKVIHAGLECGILGANYPHWDMISFGPTIRFPHSPDEKVNIKTVNKFWDFLVETLKNIPVK